MSGYAELQVTSNFSFLRGASHPGELVAHARELGLNAIAITDRNSLAGVVRAHLAAQSAGIQLIIGCRLDLLEGLSFLCLPQDRKAYANLCRLLTRGKSAAPKGECHISFDDMIEFGQGQHFIALPPADPQDGNFQEKLKRLKRHFPDRCWLAAHYLYSGADKARLNRLAGIAAHCAIPLVATNDVHYHTPERRPLQDVVTCIREKCLITQAGFRLAANAERYLKPPEEMQRLFTGHETAIENTLEIAKACTFSLDELSYNYPSEPVPPGKTPQDHLEDLTWRGADWRYSGGLPEKTRTTLKKELALIKKLNYAPYFLTVHDIVQYARSIDILCQGRGSAANSAVCYCLGVTAVDPAQIDLLFERFVSEARREPPDIDVDFEHERREEVIQYVYQRYGRHRAALTATVISYRPRSAVREVGKVMGLSEDVTGALARTVWGSWGHEIDRNHIREAGLNLDDPHLKRVIALTDELIGFPRHLSQHVGGFVLTQDPLEEMIPIGNAAMDERTFIEWDKDDIDALKILKVDVLGLGMLTCIRKCFDLIEQHYGSKYTLATLPQEDPAVYDMLSKADAIGVFQVESRAQMNMLPRMKPCRFYDLVIEVAIVRPGPIQGDMVHPYMRRRDGLEKVDYPSPDPLHGPADELENILKRTLGVPLFQEQAMQIAIDAAKFTPDEANQLRRAMATFRKLGHISKLEDKLISRLVSRGYQPDFAQRCFDQIKGFGDYGFPESHAASFALLVYVSAWIKCHYPDVFCTGLLNSQPMGFYAPAQIVRDAREHDTEIRSVDINCSHWDTTLEKTGPGRHAVRLGFRQIDGMNKKDAETLIAARQTVLFNDMQQLHERTRLSVAVLERLAAADSFRSINLDRRQALWQTRSLKDAPNLPLFDYAYTKSEGTDPAVTLPQMPLSEHVVADYQTLRLSLKAHPLSFLRKQYSSQGILTTQQLWDLKDGARAAVAGVVLVRQRPGSAKGVVFITLEDETGVANAVTWPKTMLKYRKTVMGARLMLIKGRIQRTDNIIHLVAHHLEDLSADLSMLSPDAMRGSLAHADEVARPVSERHPPAAKSSASGARRHPRDIRVIPKSRDFH